MKPGNLQFIAGMSVPVIGYLIIPFVSPLIWTDDSMGLTEGAQYLWYYFFVPAWACVSTSATGAIWNPGGKGMCTATGAILGDVLSLAVASVYCILMGKDPWYAEINMDPTVWEPEESVFILVVQPVATAFSVLGAVIGYNLSLRHRDCMEPEAEDMGYRPTWDEICREEIEWEWDKRDKDGVRLQLLRVDF